MHIKYEKFKILYFNSSVKEYKYIHNLFTFKHIVSKSMKKLIQHERKVSSWRCYPSMLHDHFTNLPPILGKKNKYKVKKHHIYNTMTPIYTIIDSKKKKKKHIHNNATWRLCN